jgi:lipopolysaccharide export system permease protein
VLSIIDRYILKSVAVPLMASFAIGLLMLLAERLVRLLDTTLGKQDSFGLVFELLAYLVPHYLGTAIPAALFLGLLFGFSNLSKNQELDAMLAAGFGLHRLARSTLFLALGFAVISVFVFGWAQPYTRYAYRSVIHEIESVDAFFLAEEAVFMQAGSRIFILDKLNRKTNTFSKVFVFDVDEKGNTDTMTSRTGRLISVPDETRPVLRLETGIRLETQTNDADPAATKTAQATAFDKFETPLGKKGRALFRARGADERELTIVELATGKVAPGVKIPDKAMKGEFHHRLVSMVVLLLLPFLALPFASGRARGYQAYRIGIALVMIVAFHEIIEQGAIAAKSGRVSPWISLWLPIGLLAAFSLWRFFGAAFSIQGNKSDQYLAAIVEPAKAFMLRLWRNGKTTA